LLLSSWALNNLLIKMTSYSLVMRSLGFRPVLLLLLLVRHWMSLVPLERIVALTISGLLAWNMLHSHLVLRSCSRIVVRELRPVHEVATISLSGIGSLT